MKKWVILLLSVGLNAALLCGVMGRLQPPAAPAWRAQARLPARPQVSARPTAAPLPPAPIPAASFHWSQLESEDFRQYMANLRAVGCPEATIRDIVVAEVERLYLERWNQVRRVPPGPFWDAAHRRRQAQEEKRRVFRELTEEKYAVMRELLGQPWVPYAVHEYYDEEITGLFLGFLPEEKQPWVASAAWQWSQRFEYQREQPGYLRCPENQAREEAMIQDLLRELGNLLTPEELEEGMLRAVSIVHLFSNHDGDLAGFNLTGAEFRELVKLETEILPPWRSEMDWRGSLPDDEEEALKAKIDERFKAVLGASRYAEYDRARNDDYRAIYRLVEAEQLPPTTAQRVFELSQAVEQRVEGVRDDPNLDQETKLARLEALQADAVRQVELALGPKAFTNYLSGHGQWLTNRFSLPTGEEEP